MSEHLPRFEGIETLLPLLNFWHQPGMTVDELKDQMDMIDNGKPVTMITESADFDYRKAIQNATTVDDIEMYSRR